MAHGTSSANPGDLARYSQLGVDLDATLQACAAALADAAIRLADAGEPVPGLAVFAESFTDVVLDWLHLDQFAAQVAEGFLACASAAGSDGSLPLTVTDADLARYAHIGYADRDTAVAEARRLADDVRSLLDGRDPSPADLDALLGRTARGRFDPAFSVTFSERIGVDGYVRLVGRIREVMLPDGGDDDALASVGVLATILTTALATARPTAADAVIDRSFVHDLVEGYDTGHLQADPQATDLSVLLSLTDPPAAIAVDIANARLSPVLYAATLIDTSLDSNDPAWLSHSGLVTNYTTMLARNSDASAQWLIARPADVDGATNMSLVLHQHAERYLDDGRAFAQVVQNAVTHPDITIRHDSLDAAMAVLAGPDRILDNPHMPDALAHGAAADMAYLDHLTNQGWPEVHLEQEPPASAWNVHSFLTEILADDSAATTTYRALEGYTMDRLAHAPVHGVDWVRGDVVDNRTEELHRIGALQGLVVAAEGNALEGSAEEDILRQRTRADFVDFTVGLVPGVGELNDFGELADISAGGLAHPSGFEPLHEAQRVQSLRATHVSRNNILMLAVLQHPEGAPAVPLRDMTGEERAAFTDWANHNHDSGDKDALDAAAGAAISGFLPA